jgi:hypothetical protein
LSAAQKADLRWRRSMQAVMAAWAAEKNGG